MCDVKAQSQTSKPKQEQYVTVFSAGGARFRVRKTFIWNGLVRLPGNRIGVLDKPRIVADDQIVANIVQVLDLESIPEAESIE